MCLKSILCNLCFVGPVCAFSARGPDSEIVFNVDENTVLVFENVDLNVCGGYNNTTGNVMLYCKNIDLNVCGGYDNTTGNVTLYCNNVDLKVVGFPKLKINMLKLACNHYVTCVKYLST